MSKNSSRTFKNWFLSVRPLHVFSKRHWNRFIYTTIIIVQFFCLTQNILDYKVLYKLANSSFPDTFWHKSYDTQRNSIRHVVNISLANETVIVLACGRNVEEALPAFRWNLYSILKLFKDYRIVLGESDSTDDTLFSFRRWQDNDAKVYIQSYGNLSKTYSSNRAHRIAFCRNNLLETMRKFKWLDRAQFLLVMDIDINANSILTVDNFLTNFEYDMRDWAVMTASQTKLYYDVWAVRTDTLEYDCWELIDKIKHREIALKVYLNIHTKPIPRDFGLIPVRSAFGGFGIYQTRYLNNCYYEAFDGKTQQKCEHVSFHDCVTNNGGRIFINPKFQNADGLKN